MKLYGINQIERRSQQFEFFFSLQSKRTPFMKFIIQRLVHALPRVYQAFHCGNQQ